MAEMRFCPQCGEPVAEPSRFCGSCGCALTADAWRTEPATPSAQSAPPAQPAPPTQLAHSEPAENWWNAESSAEAQRPLLPVTPSGWAAPAPSSPLTGGSSPASGQSRPGIALVLVVVLLAAGLYWVLGRPGIGEGPEQSSPVTVAGGGTLDLGAAGSIRIPSGAVDHDGSLRATVSDNPPGEPNDALTPRGSALKIQLDGASLTGSTTIEMPADGIESTLSDPVSILGMYFDEGSKTWVPAQSSYDPTTKRVRITTTHFSWWRVFQWSWKPVRDFVTGALTEQFGTDAVAGADPPQCARKAEAEARVRDQVHGGDNLLWCLDIDSADQVVLKAVNNRKMATQVRIFPGMELVEQSAQPLSIRYLGAFTDRWLATQAGQSLIVLGPSASATFRVTSLTAQTGIGTNPSAASYLTDVLDIGIGELSLMLGKLGTPAASNREQLYRDLFDDGQLVECLSGLLTTTPVLTDPESATAIGKSTSQILLGCLGDQTQKLLKLGEYGPVAAFAVLGTFVRTGLRMIQDLAAGGDYFRDLINGHNNLYIIITSEPQPSTGQPPTPATGHLVQRSVSVSSTTRWTDTGIDLQSGVRLSIEATGVVKIAGSDPGKYPNGATVGHADGSCVAQADFTAPGLTCWAMLGKIGDGDPFEVGSSMTQTLGQAGRLFLGINDSELGDNSGYWQAQVTACEGGGAQGCTER